MPLRPVWKLALNSHVAFPGTYDASRGYFAIDNNRLVAYDMTSGAQLWLVEAHPVLQPIAADDLVYIVDADGIVALHADSGQPAWRATLNDPFAVRPTAGPGWLISATKPGDLVALRPPHG